LGTAPDQGETDMPINRVPSDGPYGHEHLRPAWQAVLATISMLAASVLVLAIAG
jgi:hypothetical protein